MSNQWHQDLQWLPLFRDLCARFSLPEAYGYLSYWQVQNDPDYPSEPGSRLLTIVQLHWKQPHLYRSVPCLPPLQAWDQPKADLWFLQFHSHSEEFPAHTLLL